MRTRNALKISVSNYALVFKNLLYKVIVFFIFALILGIILRIRFEPLYEQVLPVLQEFKELIEALLSGDFAANTVSVESAFGGLLNYLSTNVGNIVITAIIIVVILYLYRFFSGISDCTLMYLVHEYMVSLSHLSYMRVLIENLKKTIVYRLIDSAITIVYDAVLGAVTYGIFVLLLGFLPITAVFISAIVLIGGYAVKQTYSSQIMTNMLIGNMTWREAIKRSITVNKEFFGKMFSAYLTIAIVSVYLTVSMAIFTLGAGLLVLLPFSSLALVCMRVVDYFTIEKKKYFIDYDTIIVPKELRENDENLLSDVDI